MVSPVLNEQFYSGAFLVSEARGYRSRIGSYMDNSSNADVLYEGGLVVSLVTAGTDVVTHPANTGNGTMSAATLLANNAFGAYTVTFTSPTAFNVVAPTGDVVGTGTVGAAFANQVGFTITAGGTAFVAGDSFVITVNQQTPSYVSWTGGGFTQLGILYNRRWISAGTAAKVTIIVRDAEVNAAELQWDPAVVNNAAAQATALAAFAAIPGPGIIAR